MTDALYWLILNATAMLLMPLPYVFEAVSRLGVARALGYSQDLTSGGFERPGETPAPWAQRAYRAHRNAVENFPIFAALILIAHVANVGTGLDLVAQGAMVYFFARIAHYVVYTAGIPVLRTLAYVITVGAMLAMAYVLLTHGP